MSIVEKEAILLALCRFITNGCPQWLAEYGLDYFDRTKNADAYRGQRFLNAVDKANKAGTDWDRVFRNWRMDSILPISLKAVGDGDEKWIVQCREAVQWSIDNDGAANPKSWSTAWAAWAAKARAAGAAAMAAGAGRSAGAWRAAEAARESWAGTPTEAKIAARSAWALRAMGAARSAWATRSSGPARAIGAARSTWAARETWAARAFGDETADRIEESFFRVLESKDEHLDA